SCCLARGFGNKSLWQMPHRQSREEKIDSYCLFHVALDAALFKMFPFSAGILPDLKDRSDADIFPRDRAIAGIEDRASRSYATFRTQGIAACRPRVRRWVVSL